MDAQFQPVIDAAYAGDFALFKSLLESNPELITEASDDPGDSPNLIQFVIVEGGLGKIPDPAKFLTYLIENGSTTEKQLVAAASVNARELLDILLDAGVQLDDGAPWTAVEESLYWGHRGLAEYLLNVKGAKLNTLCASAMIGDVEKLKKFFRNGKLVGSALPIYFPWGELKGSNERDAINQAFLLSLSHKQYEAASYLLDRGADINSKPSGYHVGCSALNQAIYLNDIEMVDWLLDRGAVDVKKDHGRSTEGIDMAKHHGFVQLEAYLKKRLA
ncbi:MAG: ankyrin repeat domain-containing protein [Pyrinomonadaceae bacterium]|nr:ankyrin repeat domain-containing protein [Pyrinomonadaceae bacterium]